MPIPVRPTYPSTLINFRSPASAPTTGSASLITGDGLSPQMRQTGAATPMSTPVGSKPLSAKDGSICISTLRAAFSQCLFCIRDSRRARLWSSSAAMSFPTCLPCPWGRALSLWPMRMASCTPPIPDLRPCPPGMEGKQRNGSNPSPLSSAMTASGLWSASAGRTRSLRYTVLGNRSTWRWPWGWWRSRLAFLQQPI